MTDLTQILELRKRRCERMRRDEQAAQRKCDEAREEAFSARREMDAYADEIRTLEVDLLQDLMKTDLKKADFDRLHETLAAAEARARRLSDGVKDAMKTLSKSESDIERKRRKRREVESKLKRINQMQEILTEERREAEVQAGDAEIDEIAELIGARPRLL